MGTGPTVDAPSPAAAVPADRSVTLRAAVGGLALVLAAASVARTIRRILADG
jgi:hypothetical protein